MRKMKKFLAILLASTITLGMTMTANAETVEQKEATITITNAAADAKFNCVQIIVPNPETTTGWDIVDDYTSYFTMDNAFKNMTEQQILAGMMYEKDPTAKKAVKIDGFSAKYAEALKDIHGVVGTGNETAPITVTEAGVYFIKGTDDENFTYSPMAAFVGFDEYDAENGIPADFENAEIQAKRIPLKVTKEAVLADGLTDEVTEISRVETYKVTSTVPFIPETVAERQYWAKDTLAGAEYVIVKEGENAGKVAVTVTVGADYEKDYYVTAVDATIEGKEAQKFDLDLTEILEGNTLANQAITISYQAKVTDKVVRNDILMGDGKTDGKFGSSYEELFTGNITLTKYAFEKENDDTLEDNAKLAGAEFKVYKKVGNDKVKWATFEEDTYKFINWVDSEDDAVEVVTGSNGTLTVYGLDLGEYYFKEVKAPTGYSKNETDSKANIELEGETAEAELTATTHMVDTKLIALPSTGGIGTTIFTVAGCGIMIAAAFFFFTGRKKEEN